MLRKSSLVPARPELMPVPGQKHRWKNQNCLGMKEGLKPSLASGGEEKEECPKTTTAPSSGFPALASQLQLPVPCVPGGQASAPRPPCHPHLRIHPCFSKGESSSESPRDPWPAARGWEIGSLVRLCQRGRHGALRDRQGISAEQSFPRQVMRLFLAWNLLPQLPSAPDC